MLLTIEHLIPFEIIRRLSLMHGHFCQGLEYFSLLDGLINLAVNYPIGMELLEDKQSLFQSPLGVHTLCRKGVDLIQG